MNTRVLISACLLNSLLLTAALVTGGSGGSPAVPTLLDQTLVTAPADSVAADWCPHCGGYHNHDTYDRGGGYNLPQGRRYYNGRYFGNFNNRYYGPQYGYF